MAILFLAGVFFMNRFISANLWKDFFEALEKLRKFDTDKEPVVLGDQDIEEFEELKSVLEKMTRRLSSDYRELKEYTDHTTHELQTPLAVIKTKIELLLQSENLGPDEMQLIQSINTSVIHLSRLNSTLAMITRIENQQFTEKHEIKLPDLVDHHVDMFQELIEIRGITLVRNYKDRHQMVHMDQGLADIMIANLLKNAIVHNVDGGKITLEISNQVLTIGNQGPPLALGEEELFKRFSRSGTHKSSFGLGLSLVKKICEAYGFRISYSYEEEQHIFTLRLSD
jgi:signal transduction histidine kinase